jgi:hypothetical protein
MPPAIAGRTIAASAATGSIEPEVSPFKQPPSTSKRALESGVYRDGDKNRDANLSVTAGGR